MINNRGFGAATVVPPEPRVRDHALALSILLGTLSLFLLLVWNRQVPVQDAWFNAYGQLMKEGCVPYRDFYCFIQPIPLLISRALVSGGDYLVAFRAYGALERLLLAGCLYGLYTRRFSPVASACAAFGSMMFYQGFRWDLFFHFYQTSLLGFVLALWFVLMAKDKEGVWILPFLAGVLAAISFFSKQSSGAFAVLGTGLVLLFQSKGTRRTVHVLTQFAFGGMAVAAPLLAWLGLHGALPAYVSAIYGQGAHAKGSLLNIFFTGFLLDEIGNWGLYAFMLAMAMAAIWIIISFGIFKFKIDPLESSLHLNLGWVIPALVSIVLPYFMAGAFWKWHNTMGWYTFQDTALHTVFWGAWIWGSCGVIRHIAVKSPLTDVQAMLFASALWMYASGISHELLAEYTIPAAGLFIAGITDGTLSLGSRRPLRLAVVGFCLSSCLTVLVVSERYTISYSWWRWVGGPIAQAKTASPIPFFKHIYMDQRTADMYQHIVELVQTHSQPGDQMLSWPDMPILNLISNRSFATFAPVGFMDVCPDPVAKTDAQRVAKLRPKIIAVMDLDQGSYRKLEQDHRGGRRSGQRDMDHLIQQWVDTGVYRDIATILPRAEFQKFGTGSYNTCRIRILVRVSP
jgi:hypothetical protein